jgi:hypothetical protein
MDPDAPSSPPQGPESLDPYMDGDDDDMERRNRSPTPVYNYSDKGGKPKKRLIKKSTGGKGESDGLMEQELNDWDDEVRDDMPSGSSAKKKRKKEYEKDGREKLRDRKREKGMEVERRKVGKGEKGAYGSGGLEEEEREMWNTVAGEDSEV